MPNLLASASTVSGLLDLATDLLTWLITSMGSLITFITGQPIILMMMIITLVGLVVGYLFRIWHSVQGESRGICGDVLWTPQFARQKEGVILIDAISGLWDLITIFFTTDIIYQNLFMGMFLLNLIFWCIYLLIGLLDPEVWKGGKF